MHAAADDDDSKIGGPYSPLGQGSKNVLFGRERRTRMEEQMEK